MAPFSMSFAHRVWLATLFAVIPVACFGVVTAGICQFYTEGDVSVAWMFFASISLCHLCLACAPTARHWTFVVGIGLFAGVATQAMGVIGLHCCPSLKWIECAGSAAFYIGTTILPLVLSIVLSVLQFNQGEND